MGSPKSKKAIWREWPFLIGLILTVLVLVFFAYALFCFPVVDGTGEITSKWFYLKTASPNEIGDTLAGVAGSLAFVWLVVTVWLQAKELREQRDEFEKMANAQQKQVELLVKQGEIFADEQLQRTEDRAKDELDQMLVSLSLHLGECADRHPEWKWVDGNNSDRNNPNQLPLFGVLPGVTDGEIRHAVKAISKFRRMVDYILKNGEFVEKSSNKGRYLRVVGCVNDIQEIDQRLAADQKTRLKSLGLTKLSRDIEKIMALPIWKHSASSNKS